MRRVAANHFKRLNLHYALTECPLRLYNQHSNIVYRYEYYEIEGDGQWAAFRRNWRLPASRNFLYGHAPRPIALRNGMVIGGGQVYPELNFTLPPMQIEESTFPRVRELYRQMTTNALTRALELSAPGVVVEIELLPPMTTNAEWGIEITKVVRDIMFDFEANKGLKCAMRLTPNDTREFIRPPVMRSGKYLDSMLKVFEGAAKAGADFLSIESTGGKEIHDEALVNAGHRAGDLRSGRAGFPGYGFPVEEDRRDSRKRTAPSLRAIPRADLPIPPWCLPKRA